KPQVLLLDEPFSAVDYPTRKRLHQALRQVRETFDIPIILVTHDIDDATKIADTFCFLQHGQTVESGSTETLMGQPTSRLSQWI
ncbi:MAG: ABC transporter ATP-binding protein, partial [Candidatus Methylomirabilales bacterium]